MYNHIIGVDDELWDIIEDCIHIEVYEEGVAADRKKLTAAQKKLYRKNHKVSGIIVVALPHRKYLKLSDKSTTKVCAKTVKVTRRLEKKKLILWF